MVIGHACITSLASYDRNGMQPNKKLLESRLSVQAMLEDSVCSRSRRARVEGVPAKLCLKVTERWATHRWKMTVDNLQDRCGFTREQAETRQFVLVWLQWAIVYINALVTRDLSHATVYIIQ